MENLEDIKNKTTAFKNSQVYKKLKENEVNTNKIDLIKYNK